MLAPRVRLGDRYELLEPIAAGGMGEVWRGRDVRLDRLVAIKVLKPEYAEDPSFLDRFRSEARHAAALAHPGVAAVFDYGELGPVAYLVMELVRGEPLSAVLRRDGALGVDRTLEIVAQAALALHAAHHIGVIHRDVKPGNLLLRNDTPDELVVKVTDFGIARAIDETTGSDGLTTTGVVVGTASYLSPEQAIGRPLTPASDLYSLGVVAYECLAGRRPFTGDSPLAITQAQVHDLPPPLPAAVPAPVRELVGRLLAKDPARRPSDASALARTARSLRATVAAAHRGATAGVRHPGAGEQGRARVRGTDVGGAGAGGSDGASSAARGGGSVRTVGEVLGRGADGRTAGNGAAGLAPDRTAVLPSAAPADATAVLRRPADPTGPPTAPMAAVPPPAPSGRTRPADARRAAAATPGLPPAAAYPAAAARPARAARRHPRRWLLLALLLVITTVVTAIAMWALLDYAFGPGPAKSAARTGSAAATGTVAAVSPEQFAGIGAVSGQTPARRPAPGESGRGGPA